MRGIWLVSILSLLVVGEEEIEGDGGMMMDEEIDYEEYAEKNNLKAAIPSPVASALSYEHAQWKYVTPSALSSSALLAETFQENVLENKSWNRLTTAQYANSDWSLESIDDDLIDEKGMAMKEGMKYYGMSKQLGQYWDSNKLYGSMEAKFSNTHNCGGAYFKLFDSKKTADDNVANFDKTTPYSIMFGPDHCGFTNSRVHLIIQRNIKSDDGATEKLEEFQLDKVDLPSTWKETIHQYGFLLDGDTHEYKIYIDGAVVKEGKMVEGFQGGFKSPEMIDDPDDVAPPDWTPGEPEIPDPTAVKPEDWDESQPEMIEDSDTPKPEGWLEDEPLQVPNPNAEKPEDWDDAEDGEWIRPKMKNPNCSVGCGPWKPMKKNPLYKGPWTAPMIPNPDYHPTYPQRRIKNPIQYDYSAAPFTTIEKFNSIGFELWTVEGNTIINNVMLTTSEADYTKWVEETYLPKKEIYEKNKERKEQAKKEAMANEEKSTTEKSIKYWALIAAPMMFGGLFILRRVLHRTKKDKTSTQKKTDEEQTEETEEQANAEEEKETEAETEQTTKSAQESKGEGEVRERKGRKASAEKVDTDKKSD